MGNNVKKTTDSLIVQGSVLALAGIITKIIGFVYRIPMANLLGEQGNGIYSVAFGIYNVALTLSSYSLPLAISKLVSARLAKNKTQNAIAVIKRALLFAMIAGGCAAAVLFFGAEWLEALYMRQGLAEPLRVLAPTALVVAFLGVFRGYFQGNSNMAPTALSQVVEQIVNAIVSIAATYFFVRAFANDPLFSAKGAAGATLGTLAGAFSALVMLALMFATSVGKQFFKKSDGVEKRSVTYCELIFTMLPIVLSQTVYQIGFTFDDLIFGNVMSAKGFEDAFVSGLQGAFNTQYTQLINLPVAIATALAASTLPAIVRLNVQGNTKEKNEKISSVIKLTSCISIPSAVGLSVLAEPIISALFPSLTEFHDIAVNLLRYGSVAAVFYSLSTISTSVLQGNNRMRIPVINASFSFGLHIVLVWALLKYTDLGVFALLIGDVTLPLVIAILNFRYLKIKSGFVLDYKRTLFRPLICALAMGAAVIVVLGTSALLSLPSIISLVTSVAIALAVYFLLVIMTKVFDDDELLSLPMGRKILAISKKLRK